MIITGAVVLLALYLIVTVLIFNANPVNIRVTTPIHSEYSVIDPEFKVESGIFSGSQWVYGNDIRVLTQGEEVFGTMQDDIALAEKSITKETYVFFGSNVATPMAQALADASERGVYTHFIADFIGSGDATSEQFDTMENAGVEVIRWRKPSWYQLSRLNHRTHRKLLVVDGKVGYTGGYNTADPWVSGPEQSQYKDYHFRITGPIVNHMQGMFSQNRVLASGGLLTGSRYYPVPDTTGTLAMQATSSNPMEGKMNVRKMLIYAIASADESIRMGTPYFFPDDGFLEALVDAANRNVNIQILTPAEETDKDYVRAASYTLWGDLLAAGIEMYEYQPVFYHAKMMIIDDYYVSIGSTNFDNRSFRINDEANINILDGEFGREMAAYFDDDLDKSVQITLEEWENRSTWQKAYGWFIAKVLGTYL